MMPPSPPAESDDQVLLRTVGVTKSFGPTQVLMGIDFDVRRGQIHAMVGENGAGKTTLLRIISGRYSPSSGHIEIDNKPYDALTPTLAKTLGISIVPQHVELVNDLSVADNIFLGRWPTRGGRIQRKKMLQESEKVLAQVGVAINPAVLVRELTYVQKQMVEIARICEFDPRIIILDEPTAALSVREIDILFKLVNQLRSRGYGIVFVSHYLNEVTQISDVITILRDGRVAAGGPTGSFTTEKIIQHMVGDVTDLYTTHEATRGSVCLSVKRGRTNVVRDVSFDVHQGEILGIAAPKGEGISDFLRALCRVEGKLADSQVRFQDKPLRISQAADALEKGIGYLSEERSRWGCIHGRSVRENMSTSTLKEVSSGVGVISLSRERQHIAQLAQSFGVRAPSLEGQIGTLSGGNQQKALLARLLSARLPMYILDDPTFGVDVKSKAEINRLISREVEGGAAVLLHSTDLDELLHMSDRILLIKEGHIAGQFAKGQIDLATLEKQLEA